MPVTGRARTIRMLEAIPVSVRDKVHDQMLANGGELVGAQKAAAPVDEENGGELRDSVRYHDATDESRIRVVVEAGGPTTTKPVRNGASATYDYALGQEFGTHDMPAQPFFFPTYRARRAKFKRSVKKAGRDAIAIATRKP